MKKIFLLILVALISGTTFAQKKYDVKEAEEAAKLNHAPGLVSSYKGRRVYYDPQGRQYLTEDHFKKKYGQNTISLLDSLYINGLLRSPKQRETPVAESNGRNTSVLTPRGFYRDCHIDRSDKAYKLKISTENLVVGSSLIGVSAATYMFSHSIISDKVKNLGDDFNNGKIKSESYQNKVESLEKTKRTMGYVCAGTSLAGVIVILTGLHKEYASGVNLGHNMTVSDCGAGISLTKKF